MELLVTAVVMATTIGLRDPLWRDPGLDLVIFFIYRRDPATGVQCFRRGTSAVFENDDGPSTQYALLKCRITTFKLPPKICSPVCR